ncbi:hypothetical protein [Streptomyces sp. CAU 1734]|uniref:hypothetical protein n=1 Tax=Streptomyces sp. CAU 1734 TaxID=3140360 RepID=UPI003260E00E
MGDNYSASTETSGSTGPDQTSPAAPADVMAQVQAAHQALGDAVASRIETDRNSA